MSIKKIIAFYTSDGQVFVEEDAAKKYELQNYVKSQLMLRIDEYAPDAAQIVKDKVLEFILENASALVFLLKKIV